MNCEHIAPYLPGYAGDDLRPDTTRIVGEHVGTCANCSAEMGRQRRVRVGLAALRARDLDPPPYMLDAILEASRPGPILRILPIVPLPLADAGRLIAEHRDAIASAAGTALVTAGAVYALWRAVRTARAPQPATS